MSETVPERHVWLSPLEEELLRARELEAAGKEHDDFTASEKRWLKLADTPFIPKHPVCPNCHVSMWLLEIQSIGKKVDYLYECKVCETKATVTDTNIE
jgi:tRNA(Ile2) C34 agmatinyltransferase TiaS